MGVLRHSRAHRRADNNPAREPPAFGGPARILPVAPMRLLLVCYALSGLFSLGYQVVWLRMFVDRFGSSVNSAFRAVFFWRFGRSRPISVRFREISTR